MSPISNAPALRRRACALALPGIPLALLAASLVSPTDSTSDAVQLRAAAAHAGRWQAAALLELLTAALFPLATAGIVHLVRRRGAALAHLGGLLGGLGTLGMTAIALRHLFVYGLTATSPASALRVLERLDNHGGAIAMPLMIAGPLAWLALGGAAARAGLVRRWVVAGAFLFAISDSLPIPGAEAVQSLVGVVTFGAIALAMLRLDDEQWEAPGEPAARASRSGPASEVAVGA
ncbi:MAG TPA: hypothetical protein VFJ91_05635 [Gaiellaceae bacterium]|nr:hypothetical protein [Gaiellaceae bacterium]